MQTPQFSAAVMFSAKDTSSQWLYIPPPEMEKAVLCKWCLFALGVEVLGTHDGRVTCTAASGCMGSSAALCLCSQPADACEDVVCLRFEMGAVSQDWNLFVDMKKEEAVDSSTRRGVSVCYHFVFHRLDTFFSP